MIWGAVMTARTPPPTFGEVEVAADVSMSELIRCALRAAGVIQGEAMTTEQAGKLIPNVTVYRLKPDGQIVPVILQMLSGREPDSGQISDHGYWSVVPLTELHRTREQAEQARGDRPIYPKNTSYT
jgi:hypothetical protein